LRPTNHPPTVCVVMLSSVMVLEREFFVVESEEYYIKLLAVSKPIKFFLPLKMKFFDYKNNRPYRRFFIFNI